jgi:hypothetical protein
MARRHGTWISKALIAALVGQLTFLASMRPGQAQASGTANPGGGVFIAVDDGTPRQCINVNTSVVSMFVVGVKARQNTSWLPSWLVSSSAVGVKINVTMLDPLTQNPTFTFPRAMKLKPTTSSNIVVLPMIYTLLTKFSFMNSSSNPPHPISNMSLDMDFIDIERGSPLSTVMLSLIDFSKGLPLPPNPYSTGVQLFGQFVNNLIQAAASGSSGDDAPLAAMSYDLSSLDTCGKRELTEGTTALVLDYSGNDTRGVIPTSDVGKYCFYLGNESEVTFAPKKQPNLDCEHQTGMADVAKSTLNNPQIVYTVNSYLKQGPQFALRSTLAPALPTNIKLPNMTVDKLAENLQQSRLGYDTSVATSRRNLVAWNTALNQGMSSLPTDFNGENQGASIIRLPASRAIEYDSVRALTRCLRIGIPAERCQ